MNATNEVKIFVSYSQKDREFKDEVVEHLSPLGARVFHDERMLAGTRLHPRIQQELEEANIILFLVSSHLFASDYINDNELSVALDRHSSGGVHIIPVIVRPTAWLRSPLGEFLPLPGTGRPIVDYDDRHKACADLAYGVGEVIDEMSTPATEAAAPVPGACNFKAAAPDICSSMENAHSIWMLTKTGIGWWDDYEQELELLTEKQRARSTAGDPIQEFEESRFLFLDPQSTAFDLTTNEEERQPKEKGQSLEQYKDKAMKHHAKLSLLPGFHVRTVTFPLAWVLVFVFEKRDSGVIEPTVFIEFPGTTPKYQSEFVYKVNVEAERQQLSDLLNIYNRLWHSQSGDLKRQSTR